MNDAQKKKALPIIPLLACCFDVGVLATEKPGTHFYGDSEGIWLRSSPFFWPLFRYFFLSGKVISQNKEAKIVLQSNCCGSAAVQRAWRVPRFLINQRLLRKWRHGVRNRRQQHI
jgi:hypothetical protein